MDNSKKPAFQFKAFDELGMTKREYFAGLAMQAIISGASREEHGRQNFTVNNGWIDGDSVAKNAIQCADQLLKQLEDGN